MRSLLWRMLQPFDDFSHVLSNDSPHQFRISGGDTVRNVFLREIHQSFESPLDLSFDGAV